MAKGVKKIRSGVNSANRSKKRKLNALLKKICQASQIKAMAVLSNIIESIDHMFAPGEALDRLRQNKDEFGLNFRNVVDLVEALSALCCRGLVMLHQDVVQQLCEKLDAYDALFDLMRAACDVFFDAREVRNADRRLHGRNLDALHASYTAEKEDACEKSLEQLERSAVECSAAHERYLIEYDRFVVATFRLVDDLKFQVETLAHERRARLWIIMKN